MPRIYASNNDPLDFCHKCFPSEDAARVQFGEGSPGPDGRGNCFEYDADHPDYAGENYRCHSCDARLTRRDNYPK